MPKSVVVKVRISQDLKAAVDAQTVATNMTISRVLTEALEGFVATNGVTLEENVATRSKSPGQAVATNGQWPKSPANDPRTETVQRLNALMSTVPSNGASLAPVATLEVYVPESDPDEHPMMCVRHPQLAQPERRCVQCRGGLRPRPVADA